MTWLAVTLLIGAAAAIPHAQEPPDLRAPAWPSPAAAHWREVPAFVALFVPRIDRGAYRAFVSPLDLRTVVRLLADEPDSIGSPGSWTPRFEAPSDAFGNGGTYDRWKVARLYGARQPEVARGPRGRGGTVEESWTLIGPYPAADLNGLEPGTLLLILRIP